MRAEEAAAQLYSSVAPGPKYAPRTGDHIEDYNPDWAVGFEHEKEVISRATGIAASAIEHIGSTSVPGLGAKPILDIMVAVASLSEVDKHIAALQTIGYEWRGELGVPGRVFFRKGEPRTHHLHLAKRGSAFWEEHILFRDYLREHPEAAQEYEHLKRDLIERHPDDITAYGDGKSSFILAIVEKARLH